MTESEIEFEKEEKELERIMKSMDRYNSFDDDEIDDDEYEKIYARYVELRRSGHGPQPFGGETEDGQNND